MRDVAHGIIIEPWARITNGDSASSVEHRFPNHMRLAERVQEIKAWKLASTPSQMRIEHRKSPRTLSELHRCSVAWVYFDDIRQSISYDKIDSIHPDELKFLCNRLGDLRRCVQH